MPEGDTIHKIANFLAPRLGGRLPGILQREQQQGRVRADLDPSVTALLVLSPHFVMTGATQLSQPTSTLTTMVGVWAMLSLRDEDLMRKWIDRGPDSDSDSMLVTRTVKAYYDGALGSRGARLLYEYADQPGHRGVSGSGYGFDEELMAEAMKKGFQVAIHAIGDAGNQVSLDALEAAMARHPDNPGRHRIEHVQLLHPQDLSRLAELDLIASMQPIHATGDMHIADRHWGSRAATGYAWRSLLDAGTHLAFGSDAPVEPMSPLLGIHAAVTRRRAGPSPVASWTSVRRSRPPRRGWP